MNTKFFWAPQWAASNLHVLLTRSGQFWSLEEIETFGNNGSAAFCFFLWMSLDFFLGYLLS